MSLTGLTYVHDFISDDDAANLLSDIDGQPWLTDLKRRTQHYGYKYDYTKKSVDSSLFLGALPEWIQKVANRLVETKHFPVIPDQVIVNEYLPGQGISRHIDCVPCFGDVIASLSLNSTCMMEFEQLQTARKAKIMLAPQSLLVLTGAARYDWMHSISARKEDEFNSETFKRQRRVSLTFRTMKL